MVIHLNNGNFEQEVFKSSLPVMVDFWAPWCGPCKMVAPVVEDLAREYAGRLKVGKVNVDEEPELAARFEISGIPTFVIFKNGTAVESFAGALPIRQLAARVTPYLQ